MPLLELEPCLGFRVWGSQSSFEVKFVPLLELEPCLGFRVWGPQSSFEEFRIWSLGTRIWSLGFRVFRVLGWRV